VQIIAKRDNCPIPLNPNHGDSDFPEALGERSRRSVGGNRHTEDKVGLNARGRLRASADFFLDSFDPLA